jgi:hypothetical protein
MAIARSRRRSLDDPELPSSKRPRVLGDHPRHQLSSSRRDWSNLGEGPAGLVADRLLANDVADYIRFRAVCSPWRQSSTDPRAHGILDRRFHPRKWIMLRETHDHHRRLLNVSTGQCILMPHLKKLLRGHDVFGPTTEGLLVLLHRSSYVVRLLNPLTGHTANLPPATTLLRFMEQKFSPTADHRTRFQVSDAGLADDSTFAVNFYGIQMLTVAKPGDECWTLVEVQGSSVLPASSISFEGRFYCPTNQGVMVVETSADQPPRLVLAAELAKEFPHMLSTVHLVDNGREMIMVYRTVSGSGTNSWTYDAYRVDLKAMNTRSVLELGGRAIFIGYRSTVSVSTSVFPSLKSDSIYLGLDDDMLYEDRLHCLTDGTTERSGIFDHGGFDEEYGSAIPSKFGPWGIDDFLSWYVTELEDE